MKKKYIHAEMEITEFDVEDVITTSGDQNDGAGGEGNEGTGGDDGTGDDF